MLSQSWPSVWDSCLTQQLAYIDVNISTAICQLMHCTKCEESVGGMLLQALLLLIQLTKGNANIQKIVAFENAFDRLFDVISEEGYSDGGIVVEDCLLLMLNLLRNNTSNQNFFKEGMSVCLVALFENHDNSGCTVMDSCGLIPRKCVST